MRPRAAVRLALPLAYLGAAAAAATDTSADGLSRFLGIGAVVAIGVLAFVSTLRQRVEIDDDEVRVHRLATEECVRRADVHHVARSRGRGRPAHLALDPGAHAEPGTTDGGAPTTQRRVTAVALPNLVTARQVADALGLPATSYDGGGWPPEGIGPIRTEDGRIRPFTWVVVAVLAGLAALLVAMVVAWPGS